MKFPLLPVGRRFRSEGVVYVKSGPMTAVPEAGGKPRFFPRSLVVLPLDMEALPATDEKASGLDAAAVRTAFEAYAVACDRCLAQLLVQADSNLAEGVRIQMEQAHAQFLAVLVTSDRRGLPNTTGSGQ